MSRAEPINVIEDQLHGPDRQRLYNLNYFEFEAKVLTELSATFDWTCAEGVVRSEGPLLVRRIWNQICLGEKTEG